MLAGELGELGEGLLDGGLVDGVLGAEVEVEGAFGEVGGLGDLLHASGFEALVPEDFGGSGEDFGAAELGDDLMLSIYGETRHRCF